MLQTGNILHEIFTPEMGTRLREIRLKVGLSQDAVAERMGLVGKGRSNFISAQLQGGIVERHLS